MSRDPSFLLTMIHKSRDDNRSLQDRQLQTGTVQDGPRKGVSVTRSHRLVWDRMTVV